LARMTGRPEPSQQELRANLHKRMYLLDHGPGSRHGKRFNRHGVVTADATNTGNGRGRKKVAAAAGSGAGIAAALAGDSGISTGDSAAS
jgi:hypothetical protein